MADNTFDPAAYLASKEQAQTDDFDPAAYLASKAQAAPTPARLMAYGPIEGEFTHATNFGPQGNPLTDYDVAASPDMGYQQGDWIRVNGQLHRVGDASYFSPGHPTSQTIELRDQHDQGVGDVQPAEPFDPEAYLASKGGNTAPQQAPQPTDLGRFGQGNIDLMERPVVKNPDGTISTVKSKSYEIDGKEVLLPTVAADGSGILSDQDAIAQYKKTGQFLGKFNTPEEATAYAKQLHEQQSQQYADKDKAYNEAMSQPYTETKPVAQRINENVAQYSPDWLRNLDDNVRKTLLTKDPQLAALPWYQRIPAGAGQALDAIDPNADIRSRFSAPTDFPLPTYEGSPDDSTAMGIAKGVANTPAGIWNFLSSPGGAATTAGAALAPEYAAALFASQMASDAMKPGISAQERTQDILGALLAAHGTKEAAAMEHPLAKPEPSVRRATPEEAQQELDQNAVDAQQPQQDFGTPVTEPQAPTTSATTLDATKWHDDLMAQQADAQKAARLEQMVAGRPTPYTAQRLASIQEQLRRGYQPPAPKAEAPIPADVNAEVGQQGEALPTDVKENLRPEPTVAKVGTPDEQTRRVAESPASTTTGDISGQQPTSEGERGGDVGTRPAVGDVGTGERQGSGTSNRAFTETHGEDVIPSGEGVDTTQLLDNARADVRNGAVDPYTVLSRTRERGIANPEEYAALAAEHERLVNDAVAKQKAGDPTAPQAVQTAEDFANAIQKHKTAASDLFRLFQGDVDYDISTPFGMDQYMKAEIGRTPTPSERPAFDRMSRDIGQAQADVQEAVARSDKRVKYKYARVADIPIEEAANRVKEWLKECQV